MVFTGTFRIFLLPAFMAFFIVFIQAADVCARETKCRMNFALKRSALLYETTTGNAEILCDNRQAATVIIETKGGSLRAGKTAVQGVGTFSPVWDISELLGAYEKTVLAADTPEPAGPQTLRKGEVSLSVSGAGKKNDLGISFGRITIKTVPAPVRAVPKKIIGK